MNSYPYSLTTRDYYQPNPYQTIPLTTLKNTNYKPSTNYTESQIKNSYDYINQHSNKNIYQDSYKYIGGNSYCSVKDVLHSLQSNISSLEKKILNTNNNYDFPNERDEQVGELVDTLSKKEEDIIGLRREIDTLQKENLKLKYTIDDKNRELVRLKEQFNDKEKLIIRLQQFKNDCELLNNDYLKLVDEYNKSTKIREEQEVLVGNMKEDFEIIQQVSSEEIKEDEIKKKESTKNKKKGKKGEKGEKAKKGRIKK